MNIVQPVRPYDRSQDPRYIFLSSCYLHLFFSNSFWLCLPVTIGCGSPHWHATPLRISSLAWPFFYAPIRYISSLSGPYHGHTSRTTTTLCCYSTSLFSLNVATQLRRVNELWPSRRAPETTSSSSTALTTRFLPPQLASLAVRWPGGAEMLYTKGFAEVIAFIIRSLDVKFCRDTSEASNLYQCNDDHHETCDSYSIKTSQFPREIVLNICPDLERARTCRTITGTVLVFPARWLSDHESSSDRITPASPHRPLLSIW